MADETRLRILRTAGPIFAECGFEATTVREICAAAEVNLASVNYHFGSKETLYLETVQFAHREKLLRVPLPAWPPHATAEDKLRLFVRTILNRCLGDGAVGWETRLLMREMLHPTHACRPLVEEFIRPQFDQLLELLAEVLPESTDLVVRQRIAFSIVGQCLHYRFANEFVVLLIGAERDSEAYSIDALCDHITKFSLAALAAFQLDSPSPSCAARVSHGRSVRDRIPAAPIPS
ncbi:MAG: CerR family C-terminal domain-containing protein [Planctomycetaceae bacterium]|nr:CerR family C-terminal domain-containing protein [Planctomycetaceae bacterium]